MACLKVGIHSVCIHTTTTVIIHVSFYIFVETIKHDRIALCVHTSIPYNTIIQYNTLLIQYRSYLFVLQGIENRFQIVDKLFRDRIFPFVCVTRHQ